MNASFSSADNSKPKALPIPPYKITDQPHRADNQYYPPDLPADLLAQLETLGQEAYQPNRRTPERIKNAIAKYPEQPQFYNYLATAFNLLKQKSRVKEINRKAYAKFPDYLFAKVALALEALEAEEHERVRELMGESMRLEDLYPDRKIFHTTEVHNYYVMTAKYHAMVREFERATEAVAMVRLAGRDPEMADMLDRFVDTQKMLFGHENMSGWLDDQISLPFRKFHYEDQTEDPPAFHHAEIDWLYRYDARIPEEKWRAILELPRETLIEDLETVLQDGIRRFGFFSESDWEPGTATEWFLIHAMILLGELRAYESLPAILNQLRQGDEYNDFWFGDWADDIFHTPLYNLGREQLDVIRDFCQEPYIEQFQKSNAAKVSQIVGLLEPERREEVVAWYQGVMQYFMDHADDKNLLDTGFIGFTINEAIYTGFAELKPIFKEAFDRNLVSIGVMGDWEDVEELYGETRDPKRELTWYHHDAAGQYAHLRSLTEASEKQEKEARAREQKRLELEAYEKSLSKGRELTPGAPALAERIGRNERVTVQYPDGTVRKDVKYKTVEQDVESGKAVLKW